MALTIPREARRVRQAPGPVSDAPYSEEPKAFHWTWPPRV